MAKTHLPELGQFVQFPVSSQFQGTGVYLLHHGSEIVYVGQAQSMRKRIGDHFGEGRKIFDGASCIPCPLEKLGQLERALIARLTPKYNMCAVADGARRSRLAGEVDYTLPDIGVTLVCAAGFLGITPEELRDLGDCGPPYRTGRKPRTRSHYKAYPISGLIEYKIKAA